jgi:hypothetical protein
MHASLLAQQDGGTLVVLAIVLGLLGQGLVGLTERMLALKQRIRYWATGLGIVTGILFCFATLAESRSTTTGADDLLSGILAGGMVGVFATMIWYFLVAVVTFAYEHIVAVPFRWVGRWWKRSRQRAAERRARWLEEKRYRLQQREYERSAPERARQAAAQATAQKRRDDARASCELLYSLHAPEIMDRYPKAAFDDFVKKYMGDAHPPEYVEERARQLQAIVQQHYERATGASAFGSIEQLAAWYVEQKKRIEALPLDEAFKQTHLTNLNERYAELTEKLLGSMKP